MDDIARPQILAVRDDPRLIGYYTDNEMGWWNATLFRAIALQTPRSGDPDEAWSQTERVQPHLQNNLTPRLV